MYLCIYIFHIYIHYVYHVDVWVCILTLGYLDSLLKP